MAPLQEIAVRDLVTEECVHCHAEVGGRCGTTIGDDDREAVEEKVARRRRRAGGADRAALDTSGRRPPGKARGPTANAAIHASR